MSQEITGKIHLIEEVQEISATFKKRVFVLFVLNEFNADYSDYIPFELKQDKTDLTNGLSVGDAVKVNYNPRGRKWTKDGVDRYFGSFEAWKIDKVESEASAPTQEETPPPPPSDETDDLPF